MLRGIVMKKHQIITLIFLMWALLVATQVQDKLGTAVQITYEHYSPSAGFPLPATQASEPCDKSHSDESSSLVSKAISFICVNPFQNSFR